MPCEPSETSRNRLSTVWRPDVGTQDVDAINLVNQHGSEGVLAQRFQEQAERFAKGKTGFRLIPFDFHKICGATSYDK